MVKPIKHLHHRVHRERLDVKNIVEDVTLCSLWLIILRHAELFPDLFDLAAGHLALGARGIQTAGA
jgi:hypothetical protein